MSSSSSPRSESELHARLHQQEVVSELGQQALEHADLDELMHSACEAITEVLDTDYCKVLELLPGGDEVFLRQGIGWQAGLVGNATVPTDLDSQAGYTLISEEPVIVDDLRTESRFSGPDLLVDHDVVGGISVIIGSVEEPWGVLGTHTTDRRDFSEHDATFVQNVANVLAAAIENRETKRRLRAEETLKERIVETSPIGITVIDEEGENRFANRRAEEILGRSREEITEFAHDDSRWDVVDESGESLPSERFPYQRVVKTGEPVFDEVIGLTDADGDRVWLSTNCAPMFEKGEVIGAVFAFQDVTEQKRFEGELETAFDRISDAVYALDGEWRYTFVNEQAAELLGYASEELLGESVWNVFPEAVGSDLYEQFHEAMETQKPVSFERYSDPLGIWAEVHAYPSETGLSVYFRDITERVERERELELFRTLLDHSSDSVLVADPETGRYLDVNETACQRRGYSRDEFLELSVLELQTEIEDRDAWQSYVEEVKAKGRVTFEGRHRRKDGSTYPVEINSTYVELDRGYMLGISRDVSDRKERERRLKESEQRYRTLAEHFPNGIVTLFDHDLEYQLAAGQGFEKIPVEPDDLEGKQFRDVWDEGTAGALEPAFQAALDGEERAVELTYADREWVVRAVPITDERGEVFAGMTMAQDITEQKARERYLERYETIVETVNDGVYVVDEDGIFVMVNETYAEMLGYTRDELVGADASLIVDDEEVIEVVNELHAAVEAGEVEQPTLTGELRTADGELLPVEATFAPVSDGDSGWHRAGVVRDISERKARERALEESERRHRTLVEHFPHGAVALFDEDFEYTAVGGQLLAEVEVDPEERIGHSVYELYPDDLVEEIEPYFEAALDGKANSFEVEFHGLHLYAHTLPVRDANDEAYAGMLVVQDVTERREYERRLEASNERLEQFAYAASHDLQEPLRMVSSYLQLIERRYADELDAEGQEFLEFAVDGADRMREMIEGLLEYSRIESRGHPFEPVALDEVFEDAKKDLQIALSESNAELTVEDLPRVEGDEHQLRQLFVNLLHNAIEYSGDEPPRIHVRAERATPDQDGAWLLAVEDEGIGIDPEDADRIFEVFQRLHSHDEHAGAGIGLALCERIVERHGGRLWVESEPGEGSTFYVTLPCAKNDD